MAPHNLQLQLVGCPDNPNGLPMYVTTPVSPYVADVEWNIVSGHPWGFDFCLGHFARFACLYLFHPSHPRIRVGGFRQLKTTGKPNFLKPVKGTLTRQSLMGLRVAAMPAADPLVIASVGDAPDASPPCGMEAKMEVEGLLEVSLSIASVRGRQEQLELRPFTPLIPQPNQKPRNASGTARKDIHYGSTDYRAKRVRDKFGRTPNVDGFNAYPDMAQALSYISPDEDFFKTDLNPALLYWLCPAFEMFGAMIERLCATGMQAIVIAPEWDEQQWWGPLMSITNPLPSSGAEIYEDKRLVPLPQREWATVAFFVDGQLSHPSWKAVRHLPPRRETNITTDDILFVVPKNPLAQRARVYHGARPKAQRPMRLVGECELAAKDLRGDLYARGWIEPTDSPWVSNAFPVPKKDTGKWRLVCDYRAFNEVTVADAHPLPITHPSSARIKSLFPRHRSPSLFSADFYAHSSFFFHIHFQMG